MRSPALLLAGSLLLLLLQPAAPLAGKKSPGQEAAAKTERGLLRIRNTTPYILSIYVAKIRIGWIRPYRTEVFHGLRNGVHRVYAASEYGSAAWGPRDVDVPGNISVDLEGKAAENAAIAMASRVFNANKASLLACDKMADRRGENVSTARVDFDVDIDENGKGKVKTNAEGTSSALLSCYRTMVSQWKYPATGEPYTLSFSHVH